MHTVLAFVVGALYASGLYLMLRRSLVGLIIGLALLGHAANLLIFTAGGLTRGSAPLLTEGAPVGPVADPLPQALILTAIVIGFGVLAYAVVLFRRGAEFAGTDDLDALRTTES